MTTGEENRNTQDEINKLILLLDSENLNTTQLNEILLQIKLAQESGFQVNLDLQRFFDLLVKIEDPHNIALISTMLMPLLKLISYEDLLMNFRHQLAFGLTVDNVDINFLAIRCLKTSFEKLSPNEEHFVTDLLSSDILVSLLDILGTKNIGLFINVKDFLLQVINFSSGAFQYFFKSSAIVDKLNYLTKTSETTLCRVLDFLISASEVSINAFQIIIESGLLNDVINGLKSKDLVISLNWIEIIGNLIEKNGAYLFLNEIGTFEFFKGIFNYINKAEEESEEVPVPIYLKFSAISKFLAKFSIVSLEEFISCDKKFKFLCDIEKFFLASNKNKKLVEDAVIFVGNFNHDGLQYLNTEAKLFLNNLMEIFNSSVGDLKVNCLRSLARIMVTSEKTNSGSASITETLFKSISAKSTRFSLLINYCKSPITEVKVGGYAMLKAISTQEWGVKEMSKSSEFIEFILNRSSDRSNIGAEWRYNIIQSIIFSRYAAEYFNDSTRGEIGRYATQGMFYNESVAAVATVTN